uniref:NADH-ubiquinone oxidoreductase chain 6 n=2 Tax=Coilia TaxID=286536 RepID=A5PIB9_COINA|nr:NADH dehydrogenase subunit 6 [Coilia nasus]YP_009133034.1 NADH dehydrogenase subunit 6 [Coilia brachygnathus]AIE43787.1 NADH dehydrogenase subunit 6 [Coilia nasus]AIR12122.1 NADH dehydrogenase subunit 6 [Coilia nasus]AKC05443.1 NADH dehydrogenase subunit 6 [Coilia brachygnathus]AZU95080.1 NADH dehydrogenase subunit 6 [Coilia brachygnathus]QCA40778.1 NADH dehydrogenase subunit 6 [Coilia brachygnathus]
MSYLFCMWLVLLILGLVAVASNPAPYFAALGLVVVAGAGCAVLAGFGASFLAVVLFLIYLGGMLVVFAYSAALAAEPHPEGWWDVSVLEYVIFYLVGVGVSVAYFSSEWYNYLLPVVGVCKEFFVLCEDVGGVGVMYSLGGGLLVICASVLLLSLFVVLELVRGVSRGALRAV